MIRKCLTVLLVTCCQLAWSADSMSLPKYFRASCEQYNGTWRGMITNPSELFSDGGPWPVEITLHEKDGLVVGSSNSFFYTKTNGDFAKRDIHARCDNGQLKDIFWGDTSACGSLSQQGLLVSQNTLVLALHYENAMIGANFYAFLERDKHAKQAGKIDMPAYQPKEIKTCH